MKKMRVRVEKEIGEGDLISLEGVGGGGGERERERERERESACQQTESENVSKRTLHLLTLSVPFISNSASVLCHYY